MTNKQKLVNELIDNGAFLPEAQNNLLQMTEEKLEDLCKVGYTARLKEHRLSDEILNNVDMSKREGKFAKTWKDAANDVALRAYKGGVVAAS